MTMNKDDYENAKQECWGYLCDNHRTLGETTKKCFEVTFDRAYQLGKAHAQPANELVNGLVNERLQVAAMAMQGILAGGMKKGVIKRTIELTDALLTELNKEKE